MDKIDLEQVDWKGDAITRNYVKRKADILACPSTMSEHALCDAVTFCKSISNPYAEELLRRVGMDKQFHETTDLHEQSVLLRRAAKEFGIILV